MPTHKAEGCKARSPALFLEKTRKLHTLASSFDNNDNLPVYIDNIFIDYDYIDTNNTDITF